MFNLIDRYIAKMFLGIFVGGLIVFLTLFVAVDFISNMVRFHAPMETLGQYYLLSVPGLIYQLLPVACLLGTIATLGNLSRQNELVALFSSGMSLARISLPILTMIVLLSGFSFWLGDRILPLVNQHKNFTYYVEIRKQPGLYSTVKTNRIWYRSGNILFNIKSLQAEKRHAQGITLYYFDGQWNLIQMVTAQDVDLTGTRWELQNGTVTLFAKESSVPLLQKFVKKTVVMNEELADLQSGAQSSDVLSLSELARFIARNKEAGLDTLRYEVDYHSKFGFAFAAFVMSFIGIPFSVGRQRSGGMAMNVGICIGLTFVYYAFYTSGLTLGQHGVIPPLVAAWAPNLVMLFVSVFMLVRLRR